MLIDEKEFNKLNIELTEFNIRDIEHYKNVFFEIQIYYPDVKLFYNVNANEDNTKFYYDYNEIYLQLEPYKIRIRYVQHEKKYSIHGYNNDLKNISIIESYKMENEVKLPNQIRKLSTKKIEEWINYWDVVRKELLRIDEINKNKKTLFLQTIKDEKIKWNKEQTQGQIKKNGIVFEFEISESNICQRIKLDIMPNENTYGIFKMLSDNNFNPNKK